jgi:FdhE protein
VKQSADIIRDGSIAGRVPDIPAFRPVAADVFAERSERLELLASGHASGPYLRFASALCRAQACALHTLPALQLPDPTTLGHCREHGLPPLSIDSHLRQPAWHSALYTLIADMQHEDLPAPAADISRRLEAAPSGHLEATAVRLLGGDYAQVEPGEAPFLAAALQVYWVKLALQLGPGAANHSSEIGVCPLCGSHPLASVVRIGGSQQGLRYLVCSLCASEWHVVRVKCTACGSTKGISYFGIEGGSQAVKAECCDACKAYLKIFTLEKDTSLVPAADDLASMALDILVDGEGYRRIGPNLLFLPGTA